MQATSLGASPRWPASARRGTTPSSRCFAYGGLRRGEVMAADVGDYSREAPSLMVHGKGNKDRVVPLHAVAQGALDAYLATRRGLAPEHPLFVSWRGRITKQVVVLLCKYEPDSLVTTTFRHLTKTYLARRLNEVDRGLAGGSRLQGANRPRAAGAC